MKHRRLSSRLRIGVAVAALLCLVAAAATATGPDPASAEGGDEEYVDVAMALEWRNDLGHHNQSGSVLTVIVMNHGTKSAYDVEVAVDIVYPTNTVYFQRLQGSNVPMGSVSMERTPPAGTVGARDGGGYSLRWTIPALPGLAYAELKANAVRFGYEVTDQGNEGDEIWDESQSPFKFSGEVTTSSFDFHKGNNTDRIWVESQSTHHDRYAQVKPDYSVSSVSVDEPNPSPGDIVNVTFVAKLDVNIDSRVAIGLTDGLTVDEDPDATPARSITTDLRKIHSVGDTPAPPAYSDGVFAIGTRRLNESIGTLTATLPIRVATNAVVNEQCIRVTITGSPPPGVGPYFDDISDNVAELCLGVPNDKVVLRDGTADLWALYPCVGVAASPCDNTDSVVLAVNRPSTTSDGVNPLVLEPENVVVHIPDSLNKGRYISGGSTVWNNGHDTDNSQFGAGILPGVVTKFERSLIGTDNYSQNRASVVAKAPGEGNDKGRMSVLFASNFAIKFFDTAEVPPRESYGPNNFSSKAPLFFRFTKLGTYTVDLTMGALYDSDPSDSTPPSDPADLFSDTATYTFHVGPMADLAVEDGGPDAHLAANRSALTIVAANDGPDTVSGARVTGLPTGAQVLQISQGSYDSGTGVWDIGELRLRGYYGSRAEPAPTLVLAATAGETASVSISNSKNYEVCIGSQGSTLAQNTQTSCEGVSGASWHEGTVYDHNANNSKGVTVMARRGTQGAVALRTTQPTSNIGLNWSPRSGAVAYGIQVSEDGGVTWDPLALGVRRTSYTHTDVPVGATRHYRVHAIDSEGERSLPFAATSVVAGRGARETSPPGAPEQITLTASPSSRTEILLSWVQPADFGSPITSYTLQVADGRSGPWANVSPQPDIFTVGYDYGGLEPNTRKYFRIRATNEFGGSLWSEVAEARTVAAGLPGPPSSVYTSPRENAVTLWWAVPEQDGGSPVTRYEAQWSADGSATGRWSSVGSSEHPVLDHTGAGVGVTRYYRVRARNAQGWGPWSLPPHASATTPGGEPLEDYPSLYAEPSGQNAIVIAWSPPIDRDGRAITRYELQWFEEQGIDCYAESSAARYSTLRRPSASERSFTHTGLKPSLTYCYRLRAGTTAVWSEWTISEAITEQAGTPAATSLTARANGATEITLTWTRPSDRGSRITYYELEWAEDPAAHNWSWVDRDGVPAGATSYTDGGLEPGTQRHYRIRAHNANGPGQWSAVRGATTVAGGPDVPTGLTATAHDTNQQIDLTWVAPTDTGGSAITGYWLERSSDGNAPWERLTSRNGTTWSDTRNLYPGMTRYYRVAAVNRSGAGVWSEVVASDATVIPAGGSAARAPDAPASLRFTSIGKNQVGLAWDRPPSDGGAPILRYEYQETLGQENLTTTGTTGTIRGLEEGLHYSFRVRAVNAVGGGEWSDDIFATLWPGRTEQVRVSATNLTVTEGGTVSFTVSLNQAPPLPVSLGVYPRGSADELLFGAYEYVGRALIPSGWSHPDGDDWSDRAHNWSRGVPVTITIPDDDVDNPDRVLLIDVSLALLSASEVGAFNDEWNARWGIDPERSCVGDPASTCPTEWDRASWRDFTGPSVKITVRDND